MGVVDLEDFIQVPYCGPKNMRPLTAYTLFIDLNVIIFVFVRLHSPNICLLWMGRVEGDVVKDEESKYF